MMATATENGVDAGNELTIKGGISPLAKETKAYEARVIRQLE